MPTPARRSAPHGHAAPPLEPEPLAEAAAAAAAGDPGADREALRGGWGEAACAAPPAMAAAG